MLKNAPFLITIGVDTAENEPRKESWVVARTGVSILIAWPSSCLDLGRLRAAVEQVSGGSRPTWPTQRASNQSFRRLATTHHSFLGSFSSVSKRNFASKYAFCSIFQNLQNFLAEFWKKLQNFAKFRKIPQNFAIFWKISGFLPKIAEFLRNFARFWKFS